MVMVIFLLFIEIEEEFFICQDESVEVFGEMVDEFGVFLEIFMVVNGCDFMYMIIVIEEEFIGSVNIFLFCFSDLEVWIVYICMVGNGGFYIVIWNGIVVVDNIINNILIGDYVVVVISVNGCIYIVEFIIWLYNQFWWFLVIVLNCDDLVSGLILI